MNQAAAITPARYASPRLPGKPLLDRTGMPMICHVVEQTRRARGISAVIVATDDQRIADAVNAHGGTAVMTRDDHPNGTSRVAEVAAGLPHGIDIIVNVQGDEPEIDPGLIDRLIERMQNGDEPVVTIASPFADDEDPTNPNIVKIVLDQRGRALYFSRSLIPFPRGETALPPLKHLGIYAYRRAFLERYIRLPATPAEQTEQLEQLRVLEHGHAIAAVVAEAHHHGIDTAEQYEAFVTRHAAG
ncbi:MAG: 3-deoxy-manno-octulosonate cytidylyltransferase [Planctomycetaceae bacterium]|nr:3-deoxy-manno-octulosonate cytidylyltransferase [Planctomycetaceae bacterium]